MLTIKALNTLDSDSTLARISFNFEIEEITIDYSFWHKEEYMTQWNQAINNILEGSDKEVLITSLTDIHTANFMTVWPMYSSNGKVYIQNQILFLEDLKDEFSLNNINDFIDDRDSVEDTSEWVMSLDELRNYKFQL
jgi:hypothetical protein